MWGPATPYPGASLDLNGNYQNCLNTNTPYVSALCEFNSELYVGGNFTSIGGIVSHGIARWNGNTWSTLNNGNYLQSCVSDIIEFNGKLYFTSGKLYEWNGSNITEFTYFNIDYQQTLPVGGSDLHVYNNELYIVGNGLTHGGLLKFDGTNFSQIHDGQLSINCIQDFNTNLYVGTNSGLFRLQNGNWIDCNGVTSSTPIISDLETYNNEMFASGYFTSIGGLSTNHLAKYNGTTWSSPNYVNGYSITGGGGLKRINNELYFTNVSALIPGNPQLMVTSPVIKYNGTQWNSISLNGFYPGMITHIYNNELYLGGSFSFIPYTPSPINVQGFSKLDPSILSIENNNISNLQFHPNPTSSEITITSDKFTNEPYTLYDQMGRTVGSGKLSGTNTTISLSTLSKGIYILKVEGDYESAIVVKE
jgi:hypothetical protein